MSKNKTKRKIMSGLIVAILLGLIGIRLYLPTYVKNYVNQKINDLNGYSGEVQDVDLFLWRGAYQIDDIIINKTSGGLKEPFFSAKIIDLSVEWRALFNGAIVAEIDVFQPDIKFSKTQTGEGAGWVKLVDALSPLEINKFEVHGGRISYIDYMAEPNINLFIKAVDATITNLRAVTKEGEALPSSIYLNGQSIGDGNVLIEGNMNALLDMPDFDIAFHLSEADLTAFNDYSREFAAIDFEDGTIGIYGELAAKDGRVTGYVKPVAENISMVSLKNDSNPFNALWESLASIFVELFENQSKDQFAMRIPLEGDLNNPKRNMWSGFWSIFKNAFGEAFTKDDDGTITINDVSK